MRKVLFSIIIIFASSSISAQNWVHDSVPMDSRFVTDVFYSLETGQIVGTAFNRAWDLAFYVGASGQYNFSAAVWANQIRVKANGLPDMEVCSIHKPASYWDSVTIADTSLCSSPFYNDINNYDKGAFNQNIDSSNLFDFGWGKYNQINHNLYGDSIYIVKLSTNYYKLIIDTLEGAKSIWYFRIGDLIGNKVFDITLNANAEYAGKLFAYYDINGGTELDLEPAKNTWDLHFTNIYIPPRAFGAPPTAQGPIINRGHRQAKITNYDPNKVDDHDASLASFTTDYSLSTYAWYKLGTHDTVGDISFIIKPSRDTTVLYQVVYYGLERYTRGTIEFAYRKFSNVLWIDDPSAAISSYSLFPNPSSIGEVYLQVESKERIRNANITVWDMLGSVVSQERVDVQQGTNAFQVNTSALSAGTYVLSLESADGSVLSQTFQINNQ